MSLEKWLKQGKKEVQKIKNGKSLETQKSQSRIPSQEIESKTQFTKLIKFILVCTSTKCKYQKIIMKKTLLDKDTICPKCKSKMKVK